MPIREYHCPKCEVTFEKRHNTQKEFQEAKESTQCPECTLIAEPVLNRTAKPMFYGHGFHATDYKGK